MSDYETIRVEMDERGVAAVTLSRPEKHNAMNARMISELTAAADVLGGSASVRAVVLRAEGKTFCAGGDLAWMREQAEKDRAGKLDEARTLANMLAAWNRLPKPVIARVQGNAFGGGLGLMSVSDIVIAAESAHFGLTEVRLGIIPATIGPFVMRRMGEGHARQVFFNAKPFGTDFAMRAGLVSHVADDLDAAVEEECVAILECAPGAVAAAKTLCLKLGGDDIGPLVDMTVEALADRWETREAKAGIDAFFAREAPPWRTR